jgi:uncharacterized membrane protein
MRILFSFIAAGIGALMLAIPNLSQHEFLFAVPVSREFREGAEGRRALGAFRLVVLASTLMAICVYLLAPAEFLPVLGPALPMAMALAMGLAFYSQNRRIRPFAQEISLRRREADLAPDADRLPLWAWSAVIPLVLLAAAAFYLYLHWSDIPQRFAVHWGMDGQPNRWANRSMKGVFGPLLFGAEMTIWMLLLGVAGWFGSRRARHRTVLLAAMIGVSWFQAAIFASVAVMPLLHVPVFWMVAVPAIVVIPGVAILIVKLKDSGNEAAEPTPTECWKAGMFYYNPNDPALFVEKRFGLGYTFNFANHWCWVLLLGVLVVAGSAFFVLA